MNKQETINLFWKTIVALIWISFVVVSVLFYSANHYFSHGPNYPTGDIVCMNDDRGPCREAYKEYVEDLQIPGWAKFFKSSQGELLWLALPILALTISANRHKGGESHE